MAWQALASPAQGCWLKAAPLGGDNIAVTANLNLGRTQEHHEHLLVERSLLPNSTPLVLGEGVGNAAKEDPLRDSDV